MFQKVFLFRIGRIVFAVDLLHVIPVDLNAFLLAAVQTVRRIDKFFSWDVEVDCSANFLLKGVPVLEDAAAQELPQPREESEISWREIGRVKWVGEKLEVESLNGFNRTLAVCGRALSCRRRFGVGPLRRLFRSPFFKARRDQHCQKGILTLFFDCYGPLRIKFLGEGATVNSECDVQTLSDLKKDIRNKRRNGPTPNLLRTITRDRILPGYG